MRCSIKTMKLGIRTFCNCKDQSNLASLNRIFDLQILPLLEEYFYGDLGRAQLVLGENFIEKVELSSGAKFAKSSHEFKADFEARTDWRVKDRGKWTIVDYKTILASK